MRGEREEGGGKGGGGRRKGEREEGGGEGRGELGKYFVNRQRAIHMTRLP